MNITEILGTPLRVKVRVTREVNGVQTKSRIFTDQGRLDDYLSTCNDGAAYVIYVCAQEKAYKWPGVGKPWIHR